MIVDGSWMSPVQQRETVEAGHTVFFPFASDIHGLAIRAADTMEMSMRRYTISLELVANDTGEIGRQMRKASIIAGEMGDTPNQPVLPKPRDPNVDWRDDPRVIKPA